MPWDWITSINIAQRSEAKSSFCVMEERGGQEVGTDTFDAEKSK
jgi:hypothetical protein